MRSLVRAMCRLSAFNGFCVAQDDRFAFRGVNPAFRDAANPSRVGSQRESWGLSQIGGVEPLKGCQSCFESSRATRGDLKTGDVLCA